MNKQLIYLTCLLVSALATTASAASAQEINASVDATMNNTTLNSTLFHNAATGAANAIAPVQAPVSSNSSAINLSVAKEAVQNLSTVESQNATVAPISQMALPAPLVAAGASSIQAAAPQEGSYKMGTVVNDVNKTIIDPAKREPLSLGLPTKPVRDAGKMFFVCDLV